MNYGLSLKPPSEEAGALVLVSLGARIQAMDQGIVPFRKATHCDIHVSGGEFNVAANLADCFGLWTGIATAMVDYPTGDLIAERAKAMGVIPFYKRFEHNGVTGPNMATVYNDRRHGVRAPALFYNRRNEAGALLKPGDFDWAKISARGVRWFHSGGIFAALSETTGELIVEGMKPAKAADAVTSIDLGEILISFFAMLPRWETVAFATLTVSELLRAFTARPERLSLFKIWVFSNKWMVGAVGFSLGLLLLAVYVPFPQPIFGTVPLSLSDWLWILPFSLLASIVAEATKVYLRARARRIEFARSVQMELA